MDYWDSKRSTPLFQKIDHNGRVLYGVTTEVFANPESETKEKAVDTLYFGPSLDPSAVVGQAYDNNGDLIVSVLRIAVLVDGSFWLWKTLKRCCEAGKLYFNKVQLVDLSKEQLEDPLDVEEADEIFNKLGR